MQLTLQSFYDYSNANCINQWQKSSVFNLGPSKKRKTKRKTKKKENRKKNAGYTVIRCVPLVISSLAPSLIAPSLVIPFPAPFITSYHFPLPCAITDGLESRKEAFSRIPKISVTDGRTDGLTEGPTDGPTDGRTDGQTLL